MSSRPPLGAAKVKRRRRRDKRPRHTKPRLLKSGGRKTCHSPTTSWRLWDTFFTFGAVLTPRSMVFGSVSRQHQQTWPNHDSLRCSMELVLRSSSVRHGHSPVAIRIHLPCVRCVTHQADSCSTYSTMRGFLSLDTQLL